mmetsp:Transcript_58319/g.104096  ORF Transcript_58319/g.104096 Transcript_58319/m.104096 type:complete len:263 (+) Transcript_58319:733-1521(+)
MIEVPSALLKGSCVLLTALIGVQRCCTLLGGEFRLNDVPCAVRLLQVRPPHGPCGAVGARCHVCMVAAGDRVALVAGEFLVGCGRGCRIRVHWVRQKAGLVAPLAVPRAEPGLPSPPIDAAAPWGLIWMDLQRVRAPCRVDVLPLWAYAVLCGLGAVDAAVAAVGVGAHVAEGCLELRVGTGPARGDEGGARPSGGGLGACPLAMWAVSPLHSKHCVGLAVEDGLAFPLLRHTLRDGNVRGILRHPFYDPNSAAQILLAGGV